MTVTTRFGTFEATERDVIEMVVPLAGFESCRRYLVLSSPALAPFACLHGLDAPEPSFLALDPRSVLPSFEMALDAATLDRLGAEPSEPLVWLSIVTVGAEAATVNLRAPLVINPARMVGAQHIPTESAYALDHRLSLD